MSILSTELKFYKSEEVSAATTNGGRMSTNEAISGVVSNVWPHVLKAERDAGSILYRKLFAKVANDLDETLLAAEMWNDAPTAAGDYIIMFAGTQTDTVADITGSEDIYGAANLNADITAGGSTLAVWLEDSSISTMFVVGDSIRLTDMSDPTSTTGNEEMLTISAVPTLSGSVLTITVAETITNSYTVAGGGRAMSIIPVGDIAASSSNWTETSTSGTYDEGAYPVILDNIATIEQAVTLTFTDATNFTATSDVSGVVLGSGTTGGDFSPLNSDWTKPYFTVEVGGWGGTWAAGDTITFSTHPAAYPFWLKRVVPAGTASLAGNSNTSVLSGESA